jgi:hypothetical protein
MKWIKYWVGFGCGIFTFVLLKYMMPLKHVDGFYASKEEIIFISICIAVISFLFALLFEEIDDYKGGSISDNSDYFGY